MAKFENVTQKILTEVAIYGGLPMRRGDIARLAQEHLGERAGEPFGAWYFALNGPAVETEPWPLEKAREVMAGG